MKAILALLLTIAAALVAWRDWQATIGEGFAFRPSPLGAWLEAWLPETHAWAAAQAAGPDPGLAGTLIGAALALPLALVLIVLAALVWLLRARRRRRRPF